MTLTFGLLFIVALLVLAVPFWVAIGLGTIALLLARSLAALFAATASGSRPGSDT